MYLNMFPRITSMNYLRPQFAQVPFLPNKCHKILLFLWPALNDYRQRYHLRDPIVKKLPLTFRGRQHPADENKKLRSRRPVFDWKIIAIHTLVIPKQLPNWQIAPAHENAHFCKTWPVRMTSQVHRPPCIEPIAALASALILHTLSVLHLDKSRLRVTHGWNKKTL